MVKLESPLFRLNAGGLVVLRGLAGLLTGLFMCSPHTEDFKARRIRVL